MSMTRRRESGFTLIEVLVYLGLYAIIFAGALSGVYALEESSVHNQATAMMQEEGDFLIDKIEWSIDQASSVQNSAGASSRLVLSNIDGGSMQVFSANGDMEIQSTDTQPEALNNSNTSVDDLTFTTVYTNSSPQSVSITFTLVSTTTEGKALARNFFALVLIHHGL